MGNKGRCKIVGCAAKGCCDDQFATPFASLWTTAHWLEEHSILLGNIGLDKVIRLQICAWSFILVLSVEASIPMSLVYAEQSEIEWESSTLGDPESAQCEWVGSGPSSISMGTALQSGVRAVSLLLVVLWGSKENVTGALEARLSMLCFDRVEVGHQ